MLDNLVVTGVTEIIVAFKGRFSCFLIKPISRSMTIPLTSKLLCEIDIMY